MALCLIRSESDLVSMRSALRAEAEAVGLGAVQMTKFITAASELARNILKYARDSDGTVSVAAVTGRDRTGVMATFTDRGPGIPDIDKAFADGFSTGGSLGIGLPGARRLVDDFLLTSAPGQGTTVVITMWRR